jgi:hypothetical protein
MKIILVLRHLVLLNEEINTLRGYLEMGLMHVKFLYFIIFILKKKMLIKIGDFVKKNKIKLSYHAHLIL